MGLRHHLLALGLAAGVAAAAGPAAAAYRITGMDLYGHGVVTAADPSAPPVGTHDSFHVTVDFWPPFVGNPYAPIPTDATGTFSFVTIGGPWGFEVNIEDIRGGAFCETCVAQFSLVNGALNGPFQFSAGVDPVHYLSLTDSGFYGETLGPGFSIAKYSGSFTLDGVLIHTDTPVAVPEPGTWALLLLGFGGLGAALRSRRRRVAQAA